MNTKSIAATLAFLATAAVTTVAAADPNAPPVPEPDAAARAAHPEPTKLSLFTSAGYLASSGANGGALGTGIRYAIGRHFALGFDLGYGLLDVHNGTGTGAQDRWWFIPSMAVVIPARIANRDATFDIGAGLGLGTASGYASWSAYASHPFTADWEFQLEPTVRAHAIAALAITPSLDVFVRADAAALVLPHGSSNSMTDSTWLMFSLGTRFRLL